MEQCCACNKVDTNSIIHDDAAAAAATAATPCMAKIIVRLHTFRIDVTASVGYWLLLGVFVLLIMFDEEVSGKLLIKLCSPFATFDYQPGWLCSNDETSNSSGGGGGDIGAGGVETLTKCCVAHDCAELFSIDFTCE